MAEVRSDDKARAIVEAATKLFQRYGFKRTSVEELAREAGVAKPTLYAYFEDKDAIFRAVVQAVCDELLASAVRESQAAGTLESRLTGVLAAKFTRYWELVQSSPHAAELVDSQNALGEAAIKQLDRAYLKLVVKMLEDSEASKTDRLDLPRVGSTPTSMAQLLMRAASGAAYDATSVASHRKHLGEIVRVLVAAMRPR